jgi:nucleotide-binding universal stress UspA family protein
MMKSVLLHVYDDDGLDDRLSVALDIARAHDGHLSCLHVTPFNAYVSFEPLGAAYVNSALIEELRAREAALHERVKARLVREDVPWDWSSAERDVAQAIVDAAALSDIVVLGQAGSGAGAPLPIVDDVVVNAGCSTLVVPRGVGKFEAGRPIMVAWNASPEAARAIRQALPMLRLASDVLVVSVGEDGEAFPQTAASAYLARHRISSELHTVPRGADVARTLVDFAMAQGANAIVLGAYGHSRLRETLLGGVTRHLSRVSPIPLVFGR